MTFKTSSTGTIVCVDGSTAWKNMSHQSIRIRPIESTWYRISSMMIRFCVAFCSSTVISFCSLCTSDGGRDRMTRTNCSGLNIHTWSEFLVLFVWSDVAVFKLWMIFTYKYFGQCFSFWRFRLFGHNVQFEMILIVFGHICTRWQSTVSRYD